MKRSGISPLGKWVLALTACSTPLIAAAGDGLYLGLEGGANFASGQTYRIYGFNGVIPVNDGTIVATPKFDIGWVAGVVGGYAFKNGLRPELELDYRRNDFKSSNLAGGRPATSIEGFVNTDTAMGNLWFDFFKSGSVHPYIGGGVGAARVAVRHPAYNQYQLRSDFDTVLAYQGGAGVGFDLGSHWSASVDYRYLATNLGTFDLLANDPNTNIRAHYRTHSAMLGIHYFFGAPPPPPAPAPEPEPPVQVVPTPPPPPPPCQAPAPGQPMTLDGCKSGDTLVLRGVNFDFDKATLTLDAQALLDRVVEALSSRPDIKVELDGHTDGKGSVAYNQKLSERRAASVKQYLVEHGIADARMTTQGFGKSMPIADNATDEGREMNRRVELKITEMGLVVPTGTVAPPP